MSTFNHKALTQARNKVFTLLVTATRSTSGKNAFCGHLPTALDRWALYVSGGNDVAPARGSVPIREIWMDALLEGRFRSLEGAEAFIMGCQSILPIQSQGNVQWFRPVRQASIVDQYEELPGESRAVLTWFVSLPCEIVFDTLD